MPTIQRCFLNEGELELKKFLLFASNGPDDHDLTITSFVESFNTPNKAMDYFDMKYGNNKYADGAIIECDKKWQVQYRTHGFSNSQSIYRPGWIDGWGTWGGKWEGIKDPRGQN